MNFYYVYTHVTTQCTVKNSPIAPECVFYFTEQD